MDVPELYAEINEEPVPDGLNESPHYEELYKKLKHHQQEQLRLLDTIKELADENKRILKDCDELREERESLRKSNAIYKKNAKMIFSVCRVELSKRERRIETLERRIENYGIVDGNSYSVAANSNEEDFTSQITLDLDTELKFTGILSELNNSLVSARSRSRDETNTHNSNMHSERDRPFDCRPFRGPKTPPTPSCNKPSAVRAKASSAERYDRKRDSRNSGSYQESQSKYRRYDDSSDGVHQSYHNMDQRHSNEMYEDDQDFYRERRHIRREGDVYRGDSCHSDNSHGRYRDFGGRNNSVRSDCRNHSKLDRSHDRERNYERDQFQDRTRNHDSYYKRSSADNPRTYDCVGLDKVGVHRDRDPRYVNGVRRSGGQSAHGDFEDYSECRESYYDDADNRERYSNRQYYDDGDNNSYHRSRNSRKYNDDCVSNSDKVNSHGGCEEYDTEDRHRRDGRDSFACDYQRDTLETSHSYSRKRPEKRMSHSSEKEVDRKSSASSFVSDRERHNQRKHESDNDNLNGAVEHNHIRISPASSHIKDNNVCAKYSHDHADLLPRSRITAGSNSADASMESTGKGKRSNSCKKNDKGLKPGDVVSSPNVVVSPTPVVKTNDSSGKTHVDNPSENQRLSDTRADTTNSHGTFDSPENSSPVNIVKCTDTAGGVGTSTRTKMRKVRESKPILFTKTKESQRQGEVDSINASLGVSFVHDVNKYSGKEIFHRNNPKEGLVPDDFAKAEGLRIQRKEAEDADEDHFVLGSEYKKKEKEGSELTESTFSKRMRERIEREDANALKASALTSSFTRPTDDASEAVEDGYAEEKEKTNTAEINPSINDERGVDPATSPDNQTVSSESNLNYPEDHTEINDDIHDVREDSCNHDAQEDDTDNSNLSPDDSHLTPKNQGGRRSDDSVFGVVDVKLDSGCVAQDSFEVTEEVIHASNSFDDGLSETRGSDDKNDKAIPEIEVDYEDEDPDEHYDEDAAGEDNESELHNSKTSTNLVYHEEAPSDEIGLESDNSRESPVKETSETLEWDYDDDLHLEEVDTANVRVDERQSEDEYQADVQDNDVDLNEGEMEEGEILDDSENESQHGAGDAKDADGKLKKKKRSKKSKIKKDVKAHGKGEERKLVKIKKTKGSTKSQDSHASRPERSEVSRQRALASRGKAQVEQNSRSQPLTRDESSFRSTRHADIEKDTPRNTRSTASRQHHMAEKYTSDASHADHRLPKSPAARRSRVIGSASAPSHRESNSAKVARNRHKANLVSKDGLSDNYRGRSPLRTGGSSMPSKDFRLRRHNLADRHRARR